MIYAIVAMPDVAIKIGRSDNPFGRLESLRTGCPHPLELVVCGSGGEFEETMIHAALAEYRLHGEWFRICEPVVEMVDRIGRMSKHVTHEIVGLAESEEKITAEPGQPRVWALYNWALNRIRRLDPKSAPGMSESEWLRG